MKIIKPHIFSLLWFFAYFATQIIGLVIVFVSKLLTDKNYLNNAYEILQSGTDSDLLSLIENCAMLSMFISAIMIILIFLSCLKITKQNIIKKINFKNIYKYIGTAIIINIIITFIISFIPESKYTADLTESTQIALSGSFWFILLTTGIFVPIMEEIIFRYGMCFQLSKINKIYGVIISSLIFGIMHGNLIQGIYATVLGLIFAYVNIKEDNLLPSIIMHMSINSFSVLLTFLL